MSSTGSHVSAFDNAIGTYNKSMNSILSDAAIIAVIVASVIVGMSILFMGLYFIIRYWMRKRESQKTWNNVATQLSPRLQNPVSPKMRHVSQPSISVAPSTERPTREISRLPQNDTGSFRNTREHSRVERMV